ncbi:nitrogen permease regulator 2 like protein [Pleurostoma richardsiae]|uniref:Nitrogen permease regulator 2 like protein n=1 Tax=Pleurostoma richardsiae TaxID=41990 RepID=A0AA38R7Q1_9PEZI|nr:nitrogen permease regulator 2 like protein [Pleurostoma richardsiae]
MKGHPIDELVYEYMFPKARASDPQNFQALLQRHLILEVRQEVHAYYGHLDTPEAKYPGLDYCHPTHRIRLSRWQWHRRLFRAFDALRLTPSEIAGLTKWEGTKWAKERYEKEQGVKIRDTTADGFPDWVEPEDRTTPARSSERETTQETEAHNAASDENMDGGASDEELESVGVALNERLRERVAARNAGDMSMPLDEEWEQWLKNAIETGGLPLVANQIARMSNDRNPPMTAEEIFPPRMVAAARDNRWGEIPDFLHDMIRQSLELEQNRRAVPAPTRPAVIGAEGPINPRDLVTTTNPPEVLTEAMRRRNAGYIMRRREAWANVLRTRSSRDPPALPDGPWEAWVREYSPDWRRMESELRLPATDEDASSRSAARNPMRPSA